MKRSFELFAALLLLTSIVSGPLLRVEAVDATTKSSETLDLTVYGMAETEIEAEGLIAQLSVRRYGKQADEVKRGLTESFTELKEKLKGAGIQFENLSYELRGHPALDNRYLSNEIDSEQQGGSPGLSQEEFIYSLEAEYQVLLDDISKWPSALRELTATPGFSLHGIGPNTRADNKVSARLETEAFEEAKKKAAMIAAAYAEAYSLDFAEAQLISLETNNGDVDHRPYEAKNMAYGMGAISEGAGGSDSMNLRREFVQRSCKARFRFMAKDAKSESPSTSEQKAATTLNLSLDSTQKIRPETVTVQINYLACDTNSFEHAQALLEKKLDQSLERFTEAGFERDRFLLQDYRNEAYALSDYQVEAGFEESSDSAVSTDQFQYRMYQKLVIDLSLPELDKFLNLAYSENAFSQIEFKIPGAEFESIRNDCLEAAIDEMLEKIKSQPLLEGRQILTVELSELPLSFSYDNYLNLEQNPETQKFEIRPLEVNSSFDLKLSLN